MSYPVDLDEMDEKTLIKEIARREHKRLQGLCDYCGRAPSTPACKFPERHTDVRIMKR